MAWTSPKTFVAAEVLTASEMNTYVRDNTLYLKDEVDDIPKFVPLTTPLTSTSWDGDAYSTTAKTLIDLSEVFGAPAGIKAVLVRLIARDSGSSSFNAYVDLSPSSGITSALSVRPGGKANDYWDENNGVVPCDSNGDIYYKIGASGAGTMDVVLEIWGYWI